MKIKYTNKSTNQIQYYQCIERIKKSKNNSKPTPTTRQQTGKQNNKPKYIKITRNELEVINVGYKYSFPSTNSTHIKQNMIAEDQIAIN